MTYNLNDQCQNLAISDRCVGGGLFSKSFLPEAPQITSHRNSSKQKAYDPDLNITFLDKKSQIPVIRINCS